MNALLIFAATFTMVFGLGFQSLNVNRGHPKAAFLTSFLIGTGNLVMNPILTGSCAIAGAAIAAASARPPSRTFSFIDVLPK